MNDGPLLVTTSRGVRTLTLNRPDQANALSDALMAALIEALTAASVAEDVRVVVIRGAGRNFCAGGDLKEREAKQADPGSFEDDLAWLDGRVRAVRLIMEMPKVTIAAVNGACAGAGLALASACSLRLAADTASFRSAYLGAGLSGDYGCSWTLPRLVGFGSAAEIMLLNERVTAETALAIGLVSAVHPSDQLSDAADALARRIAESPAVAVRNIVQNLRHSAVASFPEALAFETLNQVVASRTQDAAEALHAFLEHRPPRFVGR